MVKILKQKFDRDEVRARIAAGGWAVAWGDLINEWDGVTMVYSGRFSGGAGLVTWVKQQLQAQIVKFQKSLKDISPEIRQQVIDKVKDILTHRSKGEWNIHGLGVKGGMATYHRYWKGPIGGWQNLPNNYQPYIAIRITKVPGTGDSADSGTGDSAEPVQVPSSADFGVVEGAAEPPPSSIGTYEDVSLGLSHEELSKLIEKDGLALGDGEVSNARKRGIVATHIISRLLIVEWKPLKACGLRSREQLLDRITNHLLRDLHCPNVSYFQNFVYTDEISR